MAEPVARLTDTQRTRNMEICVRRSLPSLQGDVEVADAVVGDVALKLFEHPYEDAAGRHRDGMAVYETKSVIAADPYTRTEDGKYNFDVDPNPTIIGPLWEEYYWHRVEGGAFLPYNVGTAHHPPGGHITPLNTRDERIKVICAPCGMGKTEAAYDYVRDLHDNVTVLWVTPRRSLARQTMAVLAPLGFRHYMELRGAQKRNYTAAEPYRARLVCTPESLHLIPYVDGHFASFDVVIFDEFTCITHTLASSTTHAKHLFLHMHHIKFLLRDAQSVVIMCADFLHNDINVSFLHGLLPAEHFTVEIHEPPSNERTVRAVTGDKDAFDAYLFECIKAGDRLFVSCSTRAECKRLWEAALLVLSDADRQFNRAIDSYRTGVPVEPEFEGEAPQESDALMLYYHGECGSRHMEDFNDINTRWQAARIVFSTTKAALGISFTVPGHFTRVLCYMMSNGARVREMMQLNMRVRAPIDRQMIVYVAHPCPKDTTYWRPPFLRTLRANEDVAQEQSKGAWRQAWEVYHVSDNPLLGVYKDIRVYDAYEHARDRSFTLAALADACMRNNFTLTWGEIAPLPEEVEPVAEGIDDFTANWSEFHRRLDTYMRESLESEEQIMERRRHPARTSYQRYIGEVLYATEPWRGTPLAVVAFSHCEYYMWLQKKRHSIFRVRRLTQGAVAPPPVPVPILQENSQFSEAEGYRTVPHEPFDFAVQSILQALGMWPPRRDYEPLTDAALDAAQGMIEDHLRVFPRSWCNTSALRKRVGAALLNTIGLSLKRVPRTPLNRCAWQCPKGCKVANVFDFATGVRPDAHE